MLRMYVAQQCFSLSDEGIEDAIYDSQAIHGFVGIDLNGESAPDATTLLKFRHLLEANELTRKIFDTIDQELLLENGRFQVSIERVAAESGRGLLLARTLGTNVGSASTIRQSQGD